MMKKTLALSTLALAALLVTLPARAQTGGCADTPENPTLVLGGLASGAFALNALRTRYRARKASKAE